MPKQKKIQTNSVYAWKKPTTHIFLVRNALSVMHDSRCTNLGAESVQNLASEPSELANVLLIKRKAGEGN